MLQKVLQRRRNIYLSRVIVPTALRSAIGRTEITRSLRTGDRREATTRLAVWEAHIQKYLSLVWKHHSTMTRAQLDALTRHYLERSLEEIEERLADDWELPGLEEWQYLLIEQHRRAETHLASADLTSTLPEAERLLPEGDETLVRRLARRLLEAKLEVLEAEIQAIEGKPLRLPSLERLERPADPSPAATTTTPSSPRLSEVVERYSEGKRATQAWSDRSAELYAERYGTIVALLGDRPIHEVTKEDIRQLGLALTRYPKNAKKMLPGLSPREALARATNDDRIERLSPRSVNAYQQAARSLFKWAHEHDLIPANPGIVLSDVKTKGTAREERLPFSDEDLKLYFAELRKERQEEPCLFWIAAIMAYTGCRLGEVAQLRKDDLRQEQGIWVIDINSDHPGKRLKTEYSRRLVPIHPRLIELGVLDLAPATEDGFLWPEPMRTPRGTGQSPIDRLQRRLATRLARAGISHPKKTAAHSFRHTVSARLKSASVPDYQIAEVLGHKNESMSTGRYGSTTDLAKLREVIQQLKLPV